MGTALVPMLWLLAFLPGGDEDAAARGRAFYRTGTTVDLRQIEALMGQPPTAVPASVMPCKNCHGRRGHGRPEGGMIPADITWDVLTRPYELQTQTGRRRPAYDIPMLVRAITQGVDSAGTSLDPIMPRYKLNDAEVVDLIAWLRQMGKTKDPGIGEKTLHIGLLGSHGQSDAKAAWQAFIAENATNGGIYGRQLTLSFLSITGSPSEDSKALRELIAVESPFMLVMLGQTTVPPHVADFAHQQEIPLIGSHSFAPPSLYREVFYLYPGVGTHGRMLALYARQTYGEGVAFILTQPGFEKGAEAILDGCVQDGWHTRPEIIVLDPNRNHEANLKRLVALKPKYIFNMGLFQKEVDLLASLLEEANQACTVLSPEAITTSAWLKPRKAWQKLLVTTSLHAKDLEKGAAVYGGLVRRQRLPPKPNPSRLAALASAVLIQDALISAGRDLSRETMIQKLEEMFRFETGFAPAVSYNPNRRIGVNEIYLHAYDHRQRKSRYLNALSLTASQGGL